MINLQRTEIEYTWWCWCLCTSAWEQNIRADWCRWYRIMQTAPGRSKQWNVARYKGSSHGTKALKPNGSNRMINSVDRCCVIVLRPVPAAQIWQCFRTNDADNTLSGDKKFPINEYGIIATEINARTITEGVPVSQQSGNMHANRFCPSGFVRPLCLPIVRQFVPPHTAHATSLCTLAGSLFRWHPHSPLIVFLGFYIVCKLYYNYACDVTSSKLQTISLHHLLATHFGVTLSLYQNQSYFG